jgi:DNA-binding response OmpR family regulator
MSANASLEDQLRGYQAGCDDFLAKPFDPRLLVAKMNVVQRIMFYDSFT